MVSSSTGGLARKPFTDFPNTKKYDEALAAVRKTSVEVHKCKQQIAAATNQVVIKILKKNPEEIFALQERLKDLEAQLKQDRLVVKIMSNSFRNDSEKKTNRLNSGRLRKKRSRSSRKLAFRGGAEKKHEKVKKPIEQPKSEPEPIEQSESEPGVNLHVRLPGAISESEDLQSPTIGNVSNTEAEFSPNEERTRIPNLVCNPIQSKERFMTTAPTSDSSNNPPSEQQFRSSPIKGRSVVFHISPKKNTRGNPLPERGLKGARDQRTDKIACKLLFNSPYPEGRDYLSTKDGDPERVITDSSSGIKNTDSSSETTSDSEGSYGRFEKIFPLFPAESPSPSDSSDSEDFPSNDSLQQESRIKRDHESFQAQKPERVTSKKDEPEPRVNETFQAQKPGRVTSKKADSEPISKKDSKVNIGCCRKCFQFLSIFFGTLLKIVFFPLTIIGSICNFCKKKKDGR